MSRSDNYPYTGRVTQIVGRKGNIFVYTGFPVTKAIVSWVSYPLAQDEEMSSSSSSSYVDKWSSSSSSSSSFSSSSSSSSSSGDSYSSDSSFSISQSDSSSSNSSSSSSDSSVSQSDSSDSSSSISEIVGLPRLYVASYSATGFTVAYQNIPPQVGYVEFSYQAV
jgi:hypothetical protein